MSEEHGFGSLSQVLKRVLASSDVCKKVTGLFMRGFLIIFGFSSACVVCLPQAFAAEVVDVKTRGISIRLLIEGPAQPTAVMALFMGGDGHVEIIDQGNLG